MENQQPSPQPINPISHPELSHHKPLKIILTVIGLLLVSIVLVLSYQRYQANQQTVPIEPVVQPTISPSPTPSIKSDFSWELPDNWTLDGSIIHDENGKKVGALGGVMRLESNEDCQTILTSRWPSLEIINSRPYSTESYPDGYFILMKAALDQEYPPYWYPRSYCLHNNNRGYQ